MAVIILMVSLKGQRRAVGQVLIEAQGQGLFGNVAAGLVGIEAIGKGVILSPFHVAADEPAGLARTAAVGQGVAVHAPRSGVGIERRLVAVALFGDDIDDAAHGPAAVADGTAALGDFNALNSTDTGEVCQIDAPPPVARSLGIGQTLTVDEDQDPVVTVQFDVGRNARHHLIDGNARDPLEGLPDRRIAVFVHLLGGNDGRI